ncbi:MULTISPECIES: adenylate/guanylate cyclase domain-containing protein [unclassified Coleofasciculus]|uniref:adenylate/guanylate cyclase domain-containing protein n=1 Tax=unclassified Coleofasciculus TaxID=2692782 RepID=UPI00187EEFED|nr:MULTISPECIES: adenylate/guanylate cyclase domain-containing protein [unclassified Coleofasciculus]MBE9125628.1 HAMP domain-containing protein [Coleofasciculus sp. LEGE 07081]MBE9147342.1 HAMP domain-containing protein [Coleofasciculus sp. LEGE 07092]
MKVVLFRSIRTRIVTVTTLLIVAIVGAVVWSWAKNESQVYRDQKRREAQTLAVALSNAWTNELIDQNWSQIRVGLNSLLQNNPEFIYILVSDTRLSNQIVAAVPDDFQEQYFPDIVAVKDTKSALQIYNDTRIAETFLLRDIEFPKGKQRAHRGEPIIEVASDMRNLADKKMGTLRIGISMRQVNHAVRNAVQKALFVGTLGLGFGVVGAYILARQLSYPLQRLQESATKIAAGDWHHRADVKLADEIGALATAFNEMSATLQASFNRLQKTLESFERFVPEKFLNVIASDGIENIQVGVASTRLMTILFADIRGYTSMSEQMTPLETFALLNDYLACMGQVINNSGGFIDKYIGDAIMALFDDKMTGNALHAALAMQQALKEFNAERLNQGQPIIKIGIGIHRGEVVMGTIGFTSRIESTVIGDAVNVAARVEGLTRKYDCGILVTASVVTALEYPRAFDLRLVDELVKVKGKSEPVAIYHLL